MQVTIYIPKKYEDEFKDAVKTAKNATETGGVGAYLILLHKQDQERKARSFHE